MIKKAFVIFLGTIALASCIDEVDLDIGMGNDPLDILIVESTLSDEVKRHRVVLSKIDTLIDLQLDSVFNPFIPVRDMQRDFVNYEENANVSVTDGNGNVFDYVETEPGIYESNVAYGATMGNTYRLNVVRSNGTRYASEAMAIEGMASLDDVYAERMTNDEGVDGIGIFIDGSVMEGESNNFRYTYDETYKIIAPEWTPFEFRLTNYDPCALPEPTYDLEIVEREEEQQVCYRTDPSNTIIQTETITSQSGPRKFMVRFIPNDDFIISHRYSIEVQQRVAGVASYAFYEQLNNFSQTGSVFSQVQPGFLEGNLFAENGRQGAVIGFFDVVSVAKRRMFFNYTDFYPTEEIPAFPFNCGLHSSPESHISFCFSGPTGGNPCPQSIIERVNLDLIAYVGVNSDNIGTCPGPYTYVATVCGDCTQLGSNVVPEFWVE
ncbi:MAG: DUF4249 domain-containing protein [Flavobacteriaceae bacterium]|nr:DUF4249 domain-containing protein [Flavobacteriaceae bacterium]